VKQDLERGASVDYEVNCVRKDIIDFIFDCFIDEHLGKWHAEDLTIAIAELLRVGASEVNLRHSTRARSNVLYLRIAFCVINSE